MIGLVAALSAALYESSIQNETFQIVSMTLKTLVASANAKTVLLDPPGAPFIGLTVPVQIRGSYINTAYMVAQRMMTSVHISDIMMTSSGPIYSRITSAPPVTDNIRSFMSLLGDNELDSEQNINQRM